MTLLFPEEQKVQKAVSAPACYQAFCLTDSKRMGANNHKVSPRMMLKEKPNEISKMPMAGSLTCGTFAGFLVILPLQLWP